MKKLGIALGMQALLTTTADAQQDMKAKISAAITAPATTERAARADVLLIHPRRWPVAPTTLPAKYSIGPAPEEKAPKS